MSDSHIYELEDIIWDDFSISDDHPKIKQNEGSHFQAESHKKLKHEVRMTSSTGSYGVEHFGLASGETSLSSPNIKSEQVLANGSWSHNSDTFQTYDELMPCLSSERPTVASGDFIANDNVFTFDPAPANICTTADKSVSYSLSDGHQSDSDLSFLCNGHENKETDDSLFYEWPDIGNFEDVDQLLRTCDSTFGLGDLRNEDDMCWFSSLTTIDGSDAASKSEVRSSNSDSECQKIISENSESPHPNNESPAIDDLNKRSAGASYTYLASNTREQSCLSKASSIIEMPTNLNNMDEEKPLKKESYNENSQVNKISFEETSFRQLQEVIEQLDLNTKLRIRDSLYRLARSAEQRHGVVTMNNKANKHSSDELIAETKYFIKLHTHYSDSLGCAGILDIETDTNPIDRSIAHLLFHRPNDPSKKSLSDSQSLNDGTVEMSPHDDFKVAQK